MAPPSMACKYWSSLVDPVRGLRPWRYPRKGVAGFLGVAFGEDRSAELLADLPSDVPKLLVNRACADPGISSISIDREAGTFNATSFLLALGHRRVGFDILGDDIPPACDRLRGYRRAFADAGLDVDESMLFTGVVGASYLEWPKRLREVLQQERRPTALLIHHNNRILHLMEIIQSCELRVPQDLSVIIVDDDPTLSRIKPQLSAVADPYGEMGRQAVAMLLAAAQAGQGIRHVMLEPQLVMRTSVLPLGH